MHNKGLNTMVKRISLILVLGIFASAAASTAMADTQQANYGNNSSSEEVTGFVSGAIAGGLVGGPPGVMVGAVIGAVLGDGWQLRNKVGDLEANLYESRLEVALIREEALALQQEYQLAKQELDRERSRARVIPATLSINNTPCCDNTALSLHFRTGSSVIESQYREQLEGLVNLARKMPTANIAITGYADRNGDADQNLQLSRERSNSVKQFFNRMGIQNSSIQTIAYGESKPLQATQSIESDFFDRRVIVRLLDSSTQMLSQSPDGTRR